MKWKNVMIEWNECFMPDEMYYGMECFIHELMRFKLNQFMNGAQQNMEWLKWKNHSLKFDWWDQIEKKWYFLMAPAQSTPFSFLKEKTFSLRMEWVRLNGWSGSKYLINSKATINFISFIRFIPFHLYALS